MTRDKIIKGLIRGYSCDDEDDCNLSCHDCIHQKFSDYERQIRADAIDEFREYLKSLMPTEMPQDIWDLGVDRTCDRMLKEQSK